MYPLWPYNKMLSLTLWVLQVPQRALITSTARLNVLISSQSRLSPFAAIRLKLRGMIVALIVEHLNGSPGLLKKNEADREGQKKAGRER